MTLPGTNDEQSGRRRDVTNAESARARTEARRWQPRCRRPSPLDRWLCVPVFRRVCLCHCERECLRVLLWSQPYGGSNSLPSLSPLGHGVLTADVRSEGGALSYLE